ncbi:hypothetical protein CDD81_6976 [Ophiocordyceps australis]|uniref:Protein YOP1 n=1 Tax=Ophiocordyceps australis TaxID=1399860 RepID=A0A2C5YHW9_9HYPO|nr:hypothetical protein CDD81_6976 [Ophiocordyceps australis]
MFDLFPMLLSSVVSYLFPIFASYKALRTSDPAQLTPWLMYWVVLSCCLLVESWTSFILVWVPFYGYLRLMFLLYLISPQTQGARVIYQQKIHPFLEENEATIDQFIGSTHNRLKAAGITYIQQVINYIKTSLLGLPPTEHPPSPVSSTPQSYTQSLIARFSVPTARRSAATHTGNDFQSLLSTAMSAVSGFSASGGAVSGPDGLVPPNLQNSTDKMNFIAAQRERLGAVLSALDREAQQLQRDQASRPTNERAVHPGAFTADHGDARLTRSPSGLTASSGLSKSRSESDFEKVEAESGTEDDDGTVRRRNVASGSSGASWMPWGWGSGDGTDMGKTSAHEE